MKSKDLMNLLNRAAAALTNAGDLTAKDISLLLEDLHVAADTMPSEDEAIHQSTTKLPRVLITVSGGVADYVCDAGVDIEIFDHDNYEADPENSLGVPFHFADLAEPIGVPIEQEQGKEEPIYELTLVGFDGSTDATDHLIVNVATGMGFNEFLSLLESWNFFGTRIRGIAYLGTNTVGAASNFDVDFTLPENESVLRNHIISLTGGVITSAFAAESTMAEIFSAEDRKEIGLVMMPELVGWYETADQVPEWAWIERFASYGHVRNGKDCVCDFVVSLSTNLTDIPEKLKPMFAEARSKNLSYVIIHQGT